MATKYSCEHRVWAENCQKLNLSDGNQRLKSSSLRVSKPWCRKAKAPIWMSATGLRTLFPARFSSIWRCHAENAAWVSSKIQPSRWSMPSCDRNSTARRHSPRNAGAISIKVTGHSVNPSRWWRSMRCADDLPKDGSSSNTSNNRQVSTTHAIRRTRLHVILATNPR